MKIGFYGDSTQVGISVWGATAYVADHPPSAVLQSFLDQQCGTGVHTVRNYGISGKSLIDAMSLPIYPEGTILQHIAAHDDDIVVSNFAINDLIPAGNTEAAHKARYASLKACVEGAGKPFFYESPNPINHMNGPKEISFDAAVKSIPGIKVLDILGQTLAYYPQWTAHLTDGIHPNAIMYLWIGDVLHKLLKGSLS
ncbi:SGNH/GDSL hydrolase family protein [Rhizobium sp. BK661]|uniref:SGNH/GDSL hydrolase family protein n=1 Tax=Rhizobium sp. BK661 TaxID=2586991 RepID=UPI0021684DE2|nr:SGNH/GDSL hydrolase family protein [Rhizobium sp. BK661]MCS3741998.1 lysophospholipase L1-like esterase [Rhizobium sp. BK661]